MLSCSHRLLRGSNLVLPITSHARPERRAVASPQKSRAARVKRTPRPSVLKPVARAGAPGELGGANSVPMPQSPLEMISQAREAVQRGLDAGHTRQRLQLVLPVNEKQYDFLATDAVDYPCSLQAEFKSCCSLVTAILEGVTGEQEILSKVLDDGGVEGEPCSVLYPASKTFAAVVYPTSDRLEDLKSLAKEVDRPLLIVNCQWNDSGQVISDFGFGPWKKAADDFLGKFQDTYLLTEQRIGSPGSIDPVSGERFVNGGVVRLLLSYPDQYQVHALASNGANQYLSSYDNRPSYKELESLLQSARSANLEIFDIAKKASSMKSTFIPERGEEGTSGGSMANGQGVLKKPSNSEIDAMDVYTLRKYLTSMGLPTSGRVVKLKERLKDAYNSQG